MSSAQAVITDAAKQKWEGGSCICMEPKQKSRFCAFAFSNKLDETVFLSKIGLWLKAYINGV